MAFNFAHLLSAACGGAPRRLGRLRRPWARCARLFWRGYQHRKRAAEGTQKVLVAPRRCLTCQHPGSLPGCNPCSALCCESSGNQQLSGPPGAGVLPATNQLTGERSEPKSWGQIGAVNVV